MAFLLFRHDSGLKPRSETTGCVGKTLTYLVGGRCDWAWPGSGVQGMPPEDGPMDLCRVQLDGLREGGFAGASSSATLGVSQECLRFRMFHDVPDGFLSGVP